MATLQAIAQVLWVLMASLIKASIGFIFGHWAGSSIVSWLINEND
jgi:membrane protein DedA with SNARE-associated domain